MIANRYKMDLLERRKECTELRAMAIKNFIETKDDAVKEEYRKLAFDLKEYIANYDKLLQEADEISEEKRMYYKIQEVIDSL